MLRADFINHVRFLFNDGPTSNFVQREQMSSRPGNNFNGINKVFDLFNRRIVTCNLYTDENVTIDPLDYVLTPATGRIVFTAAPTNMNTYADYCWQKLMDDEISQALKLAEASVQLDLSVQVDDSMLDFVSAYALAYCYMSAASKAAEYYTMSAAGKQVSKSELFSHYMSLHQQIIQTAQNLRADYYQNRGRRDQPSAEEGTCDWARPYLQDGGV